MDPISALGLAVNIITIVDVASKVIVETREIAKGKDGYIAEHREADEVATDIQLLATKLAQSELDWLNSHGDGVLEANERELRKISEGCKSVANDLVNALRKLRPHGTFRGLAVIRSGLLIVWKKEEIDSYRSRLQLYRESMNTRILNGMREHLKLIDRDHNERFTALDESSQKLATAILESRDVFTEKLDIHTDILEDIRNRQDRTNRLLVTLTSERLVSPAPPYTAQLTGGAKKGQNALHEAARHGDMPSLRRLLNHPSTEVNAVDDDGLSAMHIAKNDTVAEELFDSSAKLLNARSYDGRTPLHLAVVDRRLNVIKFLLSKHANKTKADENGMTALDYANDCPAATFMLKYGHETEAVATDHLDNTGLMQTAWLGDLEGVRFYLSQNAKVDARNKNGETGLAESSRHGDLDVVNLLLDSGANTENKDNRKWTPLLIAVTTNRAAVVRALLSRGADKEVKVGSDCNAISEAVWKGHWDVARILVEDGARLSSQDRNGCTPMHCAVHRATFPFLDFLLSRCSLPDLNIRDNSGETPLLAAVSRGKEDMVEPLLRAGASPSIADNAGHTPLSRAAQRNHVVATKALLDYNADPSRPADSSRGGAASWSPLSEACFHNRTEIVQLLLDKRANTEIRNDENRTQLHQATRNRSSQPEIVKMLLEAGAVVDAVGPEGSTPLADACEYGNAQVIQVLLDAKANIESLSTDRGEKSPESGYTPLLRAARGALPGVISLLAKHGANLDARTATKGNTALLIAMQKNRYDAVKELLEVGAPPDHANNNGETPLMLAAGQGQVDMVRCLLNAGADQRKRDWRGCNAWIYAKHTNNDDALRPFLGPGDG